MEKKYIVVDEFNKFMWLEGRPQIFEGVSSRGYFNVFKHSKESEEFLISNEIKYHCVDKLID